LSNAGTRSRSLFLGRRPLSNGAWGNNPWSIAIGWTWVLGGSNFIWRWSQSSQISIR